LISVLVSTLLLKRKEKKLKIAKKKKKRKKRKRKKERPQGVVFPPSESLQERRKVLQKTLLFYKTST